MMSGFTEAELQAYVAETLSVSRSTELEAAVSRDAGLRARLQAVVIGAPTAGIVAIGAIWREQQLSCPNRATWAAYAAGTLGDGLRQYLEFHLTEIGCRVCAANYADLQQHGDTAAERRSRKIFATSVGRLQSDSPAG